MQRAVLQYHNTPDADTKLSPAMCLFGRPIKDFIPILPGRYKPHETWLETLAAREEALRNRHMKAHERWSEHTERLPPLVVGDSFASKIKLEPTPTNGTKPTTSSKFVSLINMLFVLTVLVESLSGTGSFYENIPQLPLLPHLT